MNIKDSQKLYWIENEKRGLRCKEFIRCIEKMAYTLQDPRNHKSHLTYKSNVKVNDCLDYYPISQNLNIIYQSTLDNTIEKKIPRKTDDIKMELKVLSHKEEMAQINLFVNDTKNIK